MDGSHQKNIREMCNNNLHVVPLSPIITRDGSHAKKNPQWQIYLQRTIKQSKR